MDSAAGAKDTSNKRKSSAWNPLDAPFQQPAQPMSVATMTSGYPHASWTKKEAAWALVALMDAARASNKVGIVRELWAAKALDPNEPDFALHRIPTLMELKDFSASVGGKMDFGMLTESASASGTAGPTAKKRRKKERFHSNDAEKGDDGYLVFPLKLSDLDAYTIRRRKAYCKVLDVKGRNNVLMANLRAHVSGRRSGVARPKMVPGGLLWSAWEVDIS